MRLKSCNKKFINRIENERRKTCVLSFICKKLYNKKKTFKNYNLSFKHFSALKTLSLLSTVLFSNVFLVYCIF